jgi:hypothetical protein
MKYSILLSLALMAAACAPLALPEPTTQPGQPDPATNPAESSIATPGALLQPTAPLLPADAGTPPAITLTRRPPELVTVPPTPAPVVGELPAALRESIEADVEQRSGVARTAFEYIRAEAIIWNDGSLGCPQPGVEYTQALVPGFWVVIRTGEAEYDYRVTERGGFVLCEPARPRP